MHLSFPTNTQSNEFFREYTVVHCGASVWYAMFSGLGMKNTLWTISLSFWMQTCSPCISSPHHSSPDLQEIGKRERQLNFSILKSPTLHHYPSIKSHFSPVLSLLTHHVSQISVHVKRLRLHDCTFSFHPDERVESERGNEREKDRLTAFDLLRMGSLLLLFHYMEMTFEQEAHECQNSQVRTRKMDTSRI